MMFEVCEYFGLWNLLTGWSRLLLCVMRFLESIIIIEVYELRIRTVVILGVSLLYVYIYEIVNSYYINGCYNTTSLSSNYE